MVRSRDAEPGRRGLKECVSDDQIVASGFMAREASVEAMFCFLAALEFLVLISPVNNQPDPFFETTGRYILPC
jgi:hypothetical protein